MAPARLDGASPVHDDEYFEHHGRPKVYLLDQYHPAAVQLAQNLFEVVHPSDPEIQNWQENAEYLLVKGSHITASQIQSAKRLRAIGKQGVGLDKIDLEACKKAGIEVFNTPGVNATAVAELVLALTMAVAREIGSIQVKQHQGLSVHKETCMGQSLTSKTIGLIGMGNISHAVARIFRGAFDASIVAYDPFLASDVWQDVPHVRAATAEEVLRSVDVVSIHVPLTKGTRDLIRLEELRSMKPNAIIINAARGGIINEQDLSAALDEGTIWGAGLDCHEEEPPTRSRYERLWAHPRVVSTPHIGAATSEAQRDTAKAAVDRIYRFAMATRASPIFD